MRVSCHAGAVEYGGGERRGTAAAGCQDASVPFSRCWRDKACSVSRIHNRSRHDDWRQIPRHKIRMGTITQVAASIRSHAAWNSSIQARVSTRDDNSIARVDTCPTTLQNHLVSRTDHLRLPSPLSSMYLQRQLLTYQRFVDCRRHTLRRFRYWAPSRRVLRYRGRR